MFESIIFRPNSAQGYPLDCGQVIESLFFYQKTVVHIGRPDIVELFKLADIEVLEELLKFTSLKVYFNNSHAAIVDYDNGTHTLDSFSLSNVDIEKELYEQSFALCKDEFKSKKFARKIGRLISVYEAPKNLSQAMLEQVQDRNLMKKVLEDTIKRFPLTKEIQLSDLEYEFEFLNKKDFIIHSNVPFNTQISTESTPVLNIINCVMDMQVMTDFSSEISLPKYNSDILRLKTNTLLERSLKSEKEINVFNHFVYNEAWALREAINTKSLHVKAVLPTLRKAQKYKEWLQGLSNDSNLMREYVATVEEKSILEKLNFKAIRFYLFAGAALIADLYAPGSGGLMGLGLSAFDTFVLDNLYHDWKPNQFIQKDLRPLVNP